MQIANLTTITKQDKTTNSSKFSKQLRPAITLIKTAEEHQINQQTLDTSIKQTSKLNTQ